MKKPRYRFYKGETSNPYEGSNVSYAAFWHWERMFDNRFKRCDSLLVAERFYQNCKGRMLDYYDRWDAPPSEKGLLIWMDLQCGRWMPHLHPKIDWELYTRKPL